MSGSIPDELLLARLKREREAREAAIAALAARLDSATSATDQKITVAASKLAARVGDRTVESSAIAGVILRTQVEPGFASAEALTLLEAKVVDGLNTSSASIDEVRRVTATQYEAVAEQTLTLRARFNANEALFRDQITAQASAAAASVVRLTSLEATVANPVTGLAAAHARVGVEESARATAVSAVASRASSLEAAVNDPATGLSATTARIAAEEQARATAVDAVAGRTSNVESVVNHATTGLAATRARIFQEEETRAPAVDAVATRTSSLEATVNSPTTGVSAAHSRISAEEQARATAVDAVATRTTSLESAVNNADTGLAATRAKVISEESTRASEIGAVASRATALEATVHNSATGVAAAHARIGAEEQARVTAVDAVAVRTTSLEATVNNSATGLAVTRARILAEEETRAAETSAVATRASALEANVNNASTGLAAAHARITAEEGARATAVESVASRASALESAVNNPSSGLSATFARIAAEETARSSADTALSGQISSVSATANSRNRTFFQSSTPTATAAGDLWIDLVNGNAVKRWDGSEWVDTTVASGAINSAVLTETNARATALTAISDRTTVLESTLNNSTTGLSAVRARVQTIEGAYVTQSYADAKKAEAIAAAAADAAARVNDEATARSSADTAISAQIGTVAASIDGRNRTFLQSSTPTATSTGDLWIDTGNGNAVKRWNGSAWVDTTVASGAIGAAVSAEASARSTADGNLAGKYSLKVAAGNIVTGMNITSATGAGTDVSDITFQASSFKIHNGNSAVAPFQVVDGKVRVTGSLVLTSGDVSGLGSLATQNAVTAGQVSGLGSLATQSSVASSQVSGLGSLATASSVDLSTQVTNKSLANLDTSANTKLAGIAANADVTLTAINGGLVITSGGLTLDGVPAIKSADYVAGSAGWAIKGNGNVEFSDGVFRGTVRAAVIDYAPLIGAGGPGLSAVMDWQHTGGDNWRTDINDSNAAFRIFNSDATSGTKTIELGVGSRQLDRVKVWGDLEMTGYGYGDFTSYSSRELKENISPVGGVLSRLMQVRVVEFDWKNGAPRAGRDVGVIAEEIEEIFPLVVVRDRSGVPAVNYPKLCVYLLRALQELGAARNEALEARS